MTKQTGADFSLTAVSQQAAPAPMVSVLMPTYNRAEYLEEAVQSVLGQSFRDLELIVIDDGSTDGTGELLRRLSDARLRVIRQAHAGLVAALNAGLAAARGQYVARNDSDDAWLPELLAVLVPALAARDEVGFAYGRSAGMRSDGSPSPGAWRGSAMRYPADPFRSLLYADYTATAATLYRRACIDRIGGYDAGVELSEDWDLALQVARESPVVFVDRVLARFRQHASNATALDSPHLATRMAVRRRVLDKIFARPDLPPSARRMRDIAYRNLHVGNAMQWLSIKHYGAAASALRQAYRSGGNPLATSLRALWSMTMWFGIGRSGPLANAVDALLRRARQWQRRDRRRAAPIHPDGRR